MLSSPKERVGISVSDLDIIYHFIVGHAQLLSKRIFSPGTSSPGVSQLSTYTREPSIIQLQQNCPLTTSLTQPPMDCTQKSSRSLLLPLACSLNEKQHVFFKALTFDLLLNVISLYIH